MTSRIPTPVARVDCARRFAPCSSISLHSVQQSWTPCSSIRFLVGLPEHVVAAGAAAGLSSRPLEFDSRHVCALEAALVKAPG